MKKTILFILFMAFTLSFVKAQCTECGPGTFINSTTGNGSISIGHLIENSGPRSIIIGSGYSEQAYLSNENANRLLIGFLSTKPTFFIGESPYSTFHDKTGSIGIGGVINPLVKLHLRSNEDEAAAIFLEPSNWTSEYNAEIFMGNMLHGISADINKGLVFKTERNYLFNMGNLGIGTEEPAAKAHIKSGDIYIENIDHGIIMKSPDGTCWRGTLNNQGQLIFESLDNCPEDELTSVKRPYDNHSTILVHPNPAKNSIVIEINGQIANDVNFTLVDVTGKIVKSMKITDQKMTISIADLVPGLYYGNFVGENINYSEKIIKQ